MRVVSLSDPSELLRQAQQRRAAADREIRQAYEDVLTAHRERVTRARADRNQARAQRR